MKRSLFILPVLAVAMVSCGNKTDNTEAVADEAEVQELALDGKWLLNDFAGETEIFTPDSTQNYYMTFNPADNTFGMTTGCNAMGGSYKITGDSLVFDNIAVTQMLCPDMTVEEGMNKILPMITTYTITPDSTLLLRSDARIMASFKYVADDADAE